MSEPPFRPAREITIAVRRAASHDRANFESSGGADPVDRRAETVKANAARPGSLMWPYTLVAMLLGGCALTWFGQMPGWGTAALAVVALVVMVWPVIFGATGDGTAETESADERERQCSWRTPWQAWAIGRTIYAPVRSAVRSGQGPLETPGPANRPLGDLDDRVRRRPSVS